MNVGFVGSGVAHARTTANCAIWMGYLDEGIHGPVKIGTSGLVRFDHDFVVRWTFPPLGAIESLINDCYAVNIDNEDVWTCYYSDFPVVQIANDSTQLWSNKGAGYLSINSLLVDRSRVALVGREEVILGRIEGGEFHRRRAVTLDLPPQANARGTQFIGQGPVLHVITPDGSWFMTDLDSLEATAN